MFGLVAGHHCRRLNYSCSTSSKTTISNLMSRHGIVMSESVSGKPSKGDFESMARRRFQDPTPKREGKWWYLLVWQDEFEGRRTTKTKEDEACTGNDAGCARSTKSQPRACGP